MFKQVEGDEADGDGGLQSGGDAASVDAFLQFREGQQLFVFPCCDFAVEYSAIGELGACLFEFGEAIGE